VKLLKTKNKKIKKTSKQKNKKKQALKTISIRIKKNPIKRIKKQAQEKTTTIKEGKAQLIIPELNEKQVPEQALVFYNPKMKFNRTNTINVLNTYFQKQEAEKPVKLLDLLSATGARAIRFAKELDFSTEIFANDVQPSAVKLIKKNTELNKVKIKISNEEANKFLVNNKLEYFNFIDIDPFGSPINFINNSIQAVKPKGGLIGLTATDTGTLAGIYEKACFRRYGIISKRSTFKHELGIRNLIASFVKIAYQHDLTARPYFSYHSIHYNRVFMEMLGGGKETRRQLKKLGFIKYCPKCERRELIPYNHEVNNKCKCGANALIFGVTWIGELAQHPFFLPEEEIQVKQPYYNISALTKIYKKQSNKKNKIIEELKKQGYKASSTHFEGHGLKTNAPYEKIIKEIIKK